MTAQLTSLLTAGAKPKPSHSRSTSLLTAGASQPSSLSSPCHRRLDTRWPRSEGGCCLSLTHHAPHKSSHSRSTSLLTAGASQPSSLSSPCHRHLDNCWPRSEGGCCLSLTHHAPHKPSHSRSISAEQFVFPMPPALRHLQALIRGWLLFIFGPPAPHKSSHSRSPNFRSHLIAGALSHANCLVALLPPAL
jgi:hypothetical protein